MEFRRELLYPPFSRLVCITIKGRVEEQVVFASEAFAKILRAGLSRNVRLGGPTPAPLARAKGYYRYQIMMRAVSVFAMTKSLSVALKKFKWPPEVSFAVDVDALSLL